MEKPQLPIELSYPFCAINAQLMASGNLSQTLPSYESKDLGSLKPCSCQLKGARQRENDARVSGRTQKILLIGIPVAQV